MGLFYGQLQTHSRYSISSDMSDMLLVITYSIKDLLGALGEDRIRKLSADFYHRVFADEENK